MHIIWQHLIIKRLDKKIVGPSYLLLSIAIQFSTMIKTNGPCTRVQEMLVVVFDLGRTSFSVEILLHSYENKINLVELLFEISSQL